MPSQGPKKVNRRSYQRRTALCAVFVTVLLLALSQASPASAQAGNVGWDANCTVRSGGAWDPITGANPSHWHQFIGVSTFLGDTWDSMRAKNTNCNRPGDTSGYWSPVVLRSDGTTVTPTILKHYYRSPVTYTSTVRPAPANLKIIAGNSMASGPYQNWDTTWDCVRPNGGVYGQADVPHNCWGSLDDAPRANIQFPGCWDGYNLDAWDHKSHMASAVFQNGVWGCPATQPVPIPRLTASIVYPARSQPGGNMNWDAVSLSTMPEHNLGRGIYSMHYDWWNTWQVGGAGGMNQLTANCINAGVACAS